MSAQQVIDGSERWYIEHADALTFLRSLPDSCVDSLVTDPPAGIGFMNRDWDKNKGDRDKWIAWLQEIMAEAWRVLKPGAHGFVWALPRTSHWTRMAVENAGFEIRDILEHLFGSGFPKSVNVTKQIAKEDAPFTGLDAQYPGLGTALKPAHEDWILIRKPLCGTIVANVLEHGTGALNIDACRVAHSSAADLAAHEAQVNAIKARGGSMENSWKNSSDLSGASDVNLAGRWPANLVLSHCDDCVAVDEKTFPANPTWATQNRECESTFTGSEVSKVQHTDTVLEWLCAEDCPVRALDKQANPPKPGRKPKKPAPPASRYFQQFNLTQDDVWPFQYVAKPNRRERDAGLENFKKRSGGEVTGREDASPGTQSPRAGAGRNGGSANVHPTVKRVSFIQYLQRLVTPPGGVTMDLFVGSGTHGVAAYREGLRFIGCEMNDTDEEPFVSIARARVTHAEGKTYIPRESLRGIITQGSLF